ncbi:MAG: polysulfide reductase NrfD [Coriobacteriales bacterium]|jgi:polysulfide reductase chain C|nr:polysulfide reductase NrfD [Coriobacteriales bacterium]
MSHKMDSNKLEKHYWIWPIAIYLFLGGLGGGTLFVAGMFDILYGPEAGYITALAVLAGVACLGFGSFLLVFELGQPLVFLRVFLSGTAILKYGACLLILAMGFGFVNFLYYLPAEWQLFYYSWTWIRDLCCWLMAICGLGVMVYTGVFLASMKAKAFWNTPALPVLFTVSALSTATVLLAILAGVWPMPADFTVQLAGAAHAAEFDAHKLVEELHFIDSILVIAEVIVLLVYVLMMRAAGNITARTIAIKWLQGAWAPLFWGGMICLGLVIPFFCYRLGGAGAEFIAPVLVLAAGLLLRFMVVFSDQRHEIAGERRFYNRLPKGDEAFLHEWKAPY